VTRQPDKTTDDPTPPETPSKATLFCPDCGHRSRFDGDWNVATSARRVRYVCPDCRTTVTTRPNGGPATARAESAASRSARPAGFLAWVRRWCRTVFPGRFDG
jgi:predicted RNA-binding Zn-ribbon protein involved in translation (DUF1610 family)